MPPDAPETILTSPLRLSIRIAGQVDDIGRFNGRIKLCGDGGTPKELVTLGELWHVTHVQLNCKQTAVIFSKK